MRRAALLLAGALMLAGCGQRDTGGKAAAPPPGDLESAAIAAGVIPDPASADMTGLYQADGDKVCVVPSSDAFRIGVSLDYGPGQNCSGSGSAVRDGERVHVSFDGADGCAFDARFEGDRIVFPGNVPDACQKLCHGRTSLSGVEADRLSESGSEAGALRNPHGELLCAG
jgi:hypothetical protein